MNITKRFKRLGPALCMATIVLLVLMPQQAYAATKSPFKDVNSSTPHYDNIVWLYNEGISTGFGRGSNRTFQPYSNVARCDMAAFLYRLAGSPVYIPTSSDMKYFSDVDSSTPHCTEIWWLASTGISRGWYENGTRTFRPYANVARCDMAAFLYRLAGEPDYSPTPSERRYFSDIHSSSPHAKEVWWLASIGVSKGWKEGDGTHTFRPYSNVVRCDMAAFINRIDDDVPYERGGDKYQEARSMGYDVYTGTVHVMTARQLCNYQGVDPKLYFSPSLYYEYGNIPSYEWALDNTLFAVLVFDQETEVYAHAGGPYEPILSFSTPMIALQGGDPSSWKGKDGETITIAVDPNRTFMATDVRLPAGATPHVYSDVYVFN